MSLQGLLPLLRERREYNEMIAALDRGAWVTGPAGPEKAYLLAALIEERAGAALDGAGFGAVLVLTPNRESAERLHDDLLAFVPDVEPRLRLLPQWEALPFDDLPPAPEITGERLRALAALAAGERSVVIAPIAAALRTVADAEAIRRTSLSLRPGQAIPLDRAAGSLAGAGYDRVELVQERGQFAVRGGIVDLYPPAGDRPIRVEWFGDEIESVRAFDPETQRTVAEVGPMLILPAREPAGEATLLDLLPRRALVVLDEPPDLRQQARNVYSQAETARRREIEAGRAPAEFPYLRWEALAARWRDRPVLSLSALHGPDEGEPVRLHLGAVEAFGGQITLLAQEIGRWTAAGDRVVVASAQAHRITEMLADQRLAVDFTHDLRSLPAPGAVVAVNSPLSAGFRFPAAHLVVVSDAEVLGWRRRRRRVRFAKDSALLRSWTELNPGDLVVHINHGIGVYRGLERLTMSGAARDYLVVEYAEGDRLYVPSDQITLVQRYVGVEGAAPKIHRLGGADWEREKRRVREAAQEMARELLDLYAKRETVRGHAYTSDTPWQQELEAAFQFEETPDQWKAIQDVKRDMEQPKPMDRLIAGDVGYGKTEVAVRAAFKAVMDGKQVAVLVPTTLLAQQHHNVFSQRLAAYPVRVEELSRFRSRREQQRILDGLRNGEVDVVIGTHRLLARDVRFKDLGLVIIDEEQRFGVAHKERLKQLRTQADVLTLTATPIPRTLHMSLLGLRDMSIMETPPDARQPIHTVVAEYRAEAVREAVLRELNRGGQVYVVHNRVETIERAAKRLRAIVPEARIVVAHGQMPEERLEQVMLDFLGGRYDVLVCTTIVEIGLDIPSVNTILVEDAHLMGLAQLYQLRGRVGRADLQAYAYLLYPRAAKLTPEAEKRLLAIREFVQLGSGFKLAMRDLEIRGAGNLLGPEQHGHLAAVGFDLYTRLLEQAIREARGEAVEDAPEPAIELRADAYLPHDYVADEAQRIDLYRRLAGVRTADDLADLRAELRDRFGEPPQAARRLLEIVRLRVLARVVRALGVSREGRALVIRLGAPLGERAATLLRIEYRGRVAVAGAAVSVQVEDRFEDELRWAGEVLDAIARYGRRREAPRQAAKTTR